MKRPQPVQRSALDNVLFRIVTRGWSQKTIADYPSRLQRHNRSLPASVTHAFQLLDGKATGLLAHVSLMIAGLGLVAPLVVDSNLEKGVVVAEIAAYLLMAVGCLRCLAVLRSHEFSDGTPHLRAVTFHELILRRELYGLCNRLTIWLTIVVFALLPVLYVYQPEH